MAIPELPPVSGGRPAPSVGLTRQGLDLAQYSPEDLQDLRTRIDQLMPVRRLKDLNMESELVLQLQAVQRLQNDVINDEDTPANQRAQTAGQVGTILATLSKLQSEVYTSERLKRIELILVEVIKKLPMEAQEEFLQAYEAALAESDN